MACENYSDNMGIVWAKHDGDYHEGLSSAGHQSKCYLAFDEVRASNDVYVYDGCWFPPLRIADFFALV